MPRSWRPLMTLTRTCATAVTRWPRRGHPPRNARCHRARGCRTWKCSFLSAGATPGQGSCSTCPCVGTATGTSPAAPCGSQWQRKVTVHCEGTVRVTRGQRPVTPGGLWGHLGAHPRGTLAVVPQCHVRDGHRQPGLGHQLLQRHRGGTQVPVAAGDTGEGGGADGGRWPQGVTRRWHSPLGHRAVPASQPQGQRVCDTQGTRAQGPHQLLRG